MIAGLFEIGSRILQSPDEKLRLAGSDILMCTLTHDPASLRNFLADPKGKPLFGQLIKGMLTPSEGGLQAQLLEMMRMLLDSDSMEAVSRRDSRRALASSWGASGLDSNQMF
jgi:protein phosphatase-4 regulatory subunit 3